MTRESARRASRKVRSSVCPSAKTSSFSRIRRRKLAGDAMVEIFQFLDRFRLDVGQLVCSEWASGIEQWARKLPVYTITASFRRDIGDASHTVLFMFLLFALRPGVLIENWRRRPFKKVRFAC